MRSCDCNSPGWKDRVSRAEAVLSPGPGPDEGYKELATAQWNRIGSPRNLKNGAVPTIKDENALELHSPPRLEAATGGDCRSWHSHA